MSENQELKQRNTSKPVAAEPQLVEEATEVVNKRTMAQVFIFSILIALVPASYFATKKFYFEDYLHYNSQESSIPSALISLVLLHVVLFAYVFLAYIENIPSPKSVKSKSD